MTRYTTPDLSFDPPAGWQDRSVTVFSAPSSELASGGPNIVLTRDALREGEGLDGYSDRQLVELAKRLDQFTLVHRRAARVGGAAAVEIAFEWRASVGTLTQRLVMVHAPSGAVLSATASAPSASADAVMSAFEAMLATARFT